MRPKTDSHTTWEVLFLKCDPVHQFSARRKATFALHLLPGRHRARGFTDFISCHLCTRCGQPRDRVGTGTTPIPKELSMPMRQVHTPRGTDSAIASVTGAVWMWQMFLQRENCFWWEPHSNQPGLEHVRFLLALASGLQVVGMGSRGCLWFPRRPVSLCVDVASALCALGLLDFEFLRPGTFSNQSLVKVMGEGYFCCAKAFCLFLAVLGLLCCVWAFSSCSK